MPTGLPVGKGFEVKMCLASEKSVVYPVFSVVADGFVCEPEPSVSSSCTSYFS